MSPVELQKAFAAVRGWQKGLMLFVLVSWLFIGTNVIAWLLTVLMGFPSARPFELLTVSALLAASPIAFIGLRHPRRVFEALGVSPELLDGPTQAGLKPARTVMRAFLHQKMR
ncbi:MAG: hypothetical protein ACR2RF_14765 [Geminicoccaceae bacterium]